MAPLVKVKTHILLTILLLLIFFFHIARTLLKIQNRNFFVFPHQDLFVTVEIFLQKKKKKKKKYINKIIIIKTIEKENNDNNEKC